MPAPADLVHENSTTTGTGNFTLSEVNGKRRFSSPFGTGGSNVFDYFISNRSAVEWERGTGSMSDANTLVRDTVIASSNANAAVNFSAGLKDVTNDIPAAKQVTTDTTQTLTNKTLTSPTLTTPAIGAATGTSVTLSAAGLPLDVTNTTNATSNQVAKLSGANSTRAANDKIYQSWFLANSSGTQKEFGRIAVSGDVVTNTSEDGRIIWSVMSAGTLTDKLGMTKTALSPITSDGLALGTTSLMWADAFFASGAVLNFNNGNVTMTHSAGQLLVNGSFLAGGNGTCQFYDVGTATSGADAVVLKPTDFAVGKPYFAFTKSTTATQWNFTLWDGSSVTGTISFQSTIVTFPSISTTASAANAFLSSGASNSLLRSTSSLIYKRDVQTLEDKYADAILENVRPVWYRSKCEADPANYGYYGFIAEEVAEIDPRLVQWGYHDESYDTVLVDAADGSQRPERVLREDAKLVPDGIAYDRFVVMLMNIVQRQEARIKALEAAR